MATGTLTQVSEFANEWFDLPQEVIDDLLFDDFIESCVAAPPEAVKASAEEYLITKRRQSIEKILESVKVANYPGLSEDGNQLLQEWVHNMNCRPTGNQEFMVMSFSNVCLNPLKFTMGTNDRLLAAEFMHKIVSKVT